MVSCAKSFIMSKLPLISVVLPSYNHVDFISTAIESVLDQKIKDFELIVVDDGSTDGTPEQVEKIKDIRVRLIRLEQNRLRHPRNIALSMARGRYIAFQNSDDEWLPDKLYAQVNILDQQKEIVACFTDVELIDNNNEVVTSSWANGLFTIENRSNLAWLRHFFTRGNCLCISSAFVRRKAIKEVGKFRGSLIQLSDFDFWVRLAAIGGFHIINQKLTRMRIISGNTVNNSDNLSAPKTSTVNRALLEFADVLGNFARSPILNLIPRVFDDVIPDLKDSMYIRQAWLAKYAWLLSSVPHSLFADRIMASIMENETARNEVTDVFGAEIIREFVRRRGQLSLKIEKDEEE